MKRILLALLLLVSAINSEGQIYTNTHNYGNEFDRFRAIMTMNIPRFATRGALSFNSNLIPSSGALAYVTADSSLNLWTGNTWIIVGSGGGGGGSQTLAQTLANGNSAGAYNVNMNAMNIVGADSLIGNVDSAVTITAKGTGPGNGAVNISAGTTQAFFNYDDDINMISSGGASFQLAADGQASISSSTNKDIIFFPQGTGQIKWGTVDTVSTRAYARSIIPSLSGYLKYSDTGRGTSQLLTGGSGKKIEDSLNAIIATKQGALTVTAIGSSGASTLIGNTLNIPQYSGGGGSSTSVDSLKVAGTVPVIGTLINNAFNGVSSLPAGWAKGSSITTTYNPGGLVDVTGTTGLTWGFGGAGVTTTAMPSALAYQTERMPWEDIDYQMTIVPQSITDSSVIAITQQTNGFNFANSNSIAVDMSNRGTQGRIKLGSGTIYTFNNSMSDSTERNPFVVGDTLIFWFHRTSTGVLAGIKNKRSGINTAVPFSQQWNNQGGQWNIVFFRGTYKFGNVTVYSKARTGGVALAGNSMTAGSGATSVQNRFANLEMRNQYRYFNAIGLPSISAKYFNLAAMHLEIINRQHPEFMQVELGFNDPNDYGSIAEFKTAIDSIGTQIARTGTDFAFMGIVPKAASTTDVYDDTLRSLCLQRGWRYVYMRSSLVDANGRLDGKYCYDGVHLNDNGNSAYARTAIASLGNIIRKYFPVDTLMKVKIAYLPVATNVNQGGVVVQQPDSSLAVIPNSMFTEAIGIRNTLSWGFGPSQTGSYSQEAAIRVKYQIATDSIFNSFSPFGLQICTNPDNGVTGATTKGSNLAIFSDGTQGVGYPGLTGKDIISGTNDVYIHLNTSKSGATGGISGANNNIFQSTLGSGVLSGNWNTSFGVANTSITTGSNNFFAGQYGGRGISTGSGNVWITPLNTGGAAAAAGVSNTIVLGDVGQGVVTGDVIFDPGNSVNPSFWFGGRAGFGSSVTWNVKQTLSGTNVAAIPLTFNLSAGTGTNVSGTSMDINSYDAVGSGATNQTVKRTEFSIHNKGVGIGVAAASIDASAQLDITSTTKGLLIPRMTTTQRNAISSPATSLTIFNTTTGSEEFYDGSAWRQRNISFGGSYTPTGTNGTNVTANTPNTTTYTRSGNVVTVFGSVQATTTLGIASALTLSLPIASNLAAVTDLNGVITSTGTATSAYVIADATNDVASLKFTAATGGTDTYYFTFQYTIQ